MNIGRLLKGENKWTDAQGNAKESDVLDIRTSNFRKRYTVSVNMKKHSSGAVRPNEVQEEDKEKPDWHIWWNPSNRGEHLASEIVGSLKLARSEAGLLYQRGSIQDPTFDNGVMWISVFVLDDENRKTQLNHHGNIAWSAPRKQNNNNQNSGYNQPMAQPSYQTEVEIQDANGNVINSYQEPNATQQQMPNQSEVSPAETDKECPF